VGVRAACQEDNDLSFSTPAHGAADPGKGLMAAHPNGTDAQLAAVLSSLSDDKAEDVVSIDLRGRSAMADHMIIASGRSTRQVAAISEKLVDRLKQDHGIACKIEGKDTSDWVLIDTGDIIVHVFRPEVREFYQLEKMWMEPEAAAARTGAH